MATSKMVGDSSPGSPSDGAPCLDMVEHVISNTREIPKLMKTNYHEWTLEVMVNLEGIEL